MKARKPKRMKVWVNTSPDRWSLNSFFPSASEARKHFFPTLEGERQAVRLVELRKGEVLVSVEALAEEICLWFETEDTHFVQTLVRKAGVR